MTDNMDSMDEDEDVLIEGGVLHTYLNENGFILPEFETIQPLKKKTTVAESENSVSDQEQVPFWVQRHLDLIMKSGLLFEDHSYFVESFLPVRVGSGTSKWRTYILTATSWVGALCSSGFLLKNIRHPAIGAVTAASLTLPIAVYCTLLLREQRETVLSLKYLHEAILKLEKLFCQLKKCILIIQEANALFSKFKLPGIELLELRKSVRCYLKEVIYHLSDFTANLMEFCPLDGKVDATAYCISREEIQKSLLDEDHEDALSPGTLKRIFSIYLLVQSELLRRLALCYCPDMWLLQTKKRLPYLSSFYRSLAQWSSDVYQKLDKAVKVYEAFGGTYEKKSKIKGSPVVTGIRSDIYVTIRSSSLHLQSVLARSRELEDTLEISFPDDPVDNVVFLEGLLITLKDMQKDLRTSQVFLEDALVHVLKSKNALDGAPCEEENEESEQLVARNEIKVLQEVELNPPVEDDVFEAVIKREPEEVTREENEVILLEDREEREKEKQKSLRVLSELKVVLKDKASEWKKREKKARERKGGPLDEDDTDSAEETLDFPPISNQRDWPLPRLKTTILNPRKKTVHRISSVESKERSDEEACVQESFIPGSAFDPGLLAEAMKKSLAFAGKREEDCFGDSGDDAD